MVFDVYNEYLVVMVRTMSQAEVVEEFSKKIVFFLDMGYCRVASTCLLSCW